MERLGLCLYASSVDNEWPSLVALNPEAIVAIDAYHLPRALGARPYWLWRPWLPGAMREHTPQQWVNAVYEQWQSKGHHAFHGLQFLNEPNLAKESGYREGSLESAQATVAWGLEVCDLIRTAWPAREFHLHSPPLSPNVPGWQNYYHWLAPLIDACDVLNVHCYLDQPTSYRDPHQLYANMPLVISECGDRQNGSAEYAWALLNWRDALPDYVDWAAIYVYNSTDGQDAAWELHGKAAEEILIECGWQ